MDRNFEVYLGNTMSKSSQTKMIRRIDWICAHARGRVLDVGCSQGLLPWLLANRGQTAVGIDRDGAAIAWFNDRYGNACADKPLELIEGDFIDYQFDGQFDTIVAAEYLEHLDKQELDAHLRKIVSLLAKGGSFIVTVPFGIQPHPDHKQAFMPQNLTRLLGSHFSLRELSAADGFLRAVCDCEEPWQMPGDALLLTLAEQGLLEFQKDFYTRLGYTLMGDAGESKISLRGHIGEKSSPAPGSESGVQAAYPQNCELVKLSLDTCPFCKSRLENFDDGQNCPVCGSRARFRAIHAAVEKYFLPLLNANPLPALPTLGFAMSGMEKQATSPIFQDIKSASLYGSYGRGTETGVDVRTMPQYQSESFGSIYSCGLFDYFLEHGQALAECFRVLAPGGLFLTSIMPYRLLGGYEKPVVAKIFHGRPGYFAYLPPGVELPSVKVGRQYFFEEMRRAGFDVTVISVSDPSDVVTEWFVGRKPVARPSANHSAHPNSQADNSFPVKISEVFSETFSLAQRKCRLSFELIEACKGSIHFLEDHICTGVDGKPERELVARNGSSNMLLLSQDNGASWMPLYPDLNLNGRIRQVFSLMDGSRLVRTDKGCICHLARTGEIISEQITGSNGWHGSQGIGQSATGIVMYAENPNQQEGVTEVAIWRYNPDRPWAGWQRVLALPGGSKPPEGAIAHFHVCRPIPPDNKKWLLASGDVGVHCRLWISDDDGQTWDEKLLPREQLQAYPEPWRFTQFAVTTDGKIIWGSDDTHRAQKAALFTLDVNITPPYVAFKEWLGKECIRNIATLGNNRFLLFSESKATTTHADCFVVDLDTGDIARIELPNLSGKKTGFTFSSASSRRYDYYVFLPAQGGILIESERRGIFRFSLYGV